MSNKSQTELSKSKISTFGEQAFIHKGIKFAHYSGLAPGQTAFKTATRPQKQFFTGFAAFLILAFLLNWHSTLLFLLSVLVILYFLDSLFNAFLIFRSFFKGPEIKVSTEEIQNQNEASWPSYTVFCPLYKEWRVVPQFVRAISALNYPKEKLQVLLLLEEDDVETVKKIQAQNLPGYFEIIIVPHALPKTKPKAMNYGLHFAKGEYLVIYDAEDVPDPDQLKKAVLALKKVSAKTVCIQAKLNFYNPHQNLLTRVFTAEYSLWFDLILTGLQSIGAPIPLGGTSNHFKTQKLKEIDGWDAFNVTEDCDLGMRLARRGYKTAIVDSTTMEEANSGFKNWYSQRSRWIKGYMQTYLVHMRNPKEFVQTGGLRDFVMMQLTIGGKILSLFINPLMWLITLAYFLFRSHVGVFIESFFPGPILYIGVASLVFGNFLYLYYYMIGCAKRGQYELIKYVYLVPLYWLYMSAAAWQALYEIVVKPHYWAKTAHGLHLDKEILDAEQEVGKIQGPEMKRRLKGFFAGAFGSGSFLVLATITANFLNFLFNAILGRSLTLEDFATVTLYNTVLNISAVALTSLGGAVTYKTAYLLGQSRAQASEKFLNFIRRGVWWLAGVASVLWLVLTPLFSNFFRVNNIWLAFSFTPVIVLGSLASVQNGYLRGRFRFSWLAQALIYEALSKTVLAVLLVAAGRHEWASLAIPGSIITSFGTSWLFVRRLKLKDARELDSLKADEPIEQFPAGYFTAAIVSGLAGTIFLNVDVLLAKHYLDPGTAGAYALLSLVGKMVYFMGTLLSPFVSSVVSRHEGAGTNSRRDFYRLLGGTAALSGFSFMGLIVFGRFVVPLLLGARSSEIVPYLAPYCLAMALFSVSSTTISYHTIKRQYSFAWLLLVSSAFLVGGIVLKHDSIAMFAQVMMYSGLLGATLVFGWHLLRSRTRSIASNWKDFVQAFGPGLARDSAGGKRILLFNWRDTKHTYAGGAEVYVHELARRWVAAGNQVTQFCGSDGRQARTEIVDGVQIVRRGGTYTVYLWALMYYFMQFRGKFDVILDCHNGIPFFTPLFTNEKVYCLMHHVHQNVFYRHLPGPLASFAAFLENTMMPLVYRSTKFITISDSSKFEMLDLGLGKAGLELVHPGADLKNLKPGTKYAEPLVVYLGRLKAYKSVDVLLRAFKVVVAQLPQAKLVIAGGGEESENLERLTDELGLENNVAFPGKISEQQKISLLKSAWVFCNPSMMEGWGITSIEANACGVPVVAADVPGLRDSVKNPHTGYLVPHGNVEAFAEKILKILVDGELQNFMSENSLKWAANFNWDKSADQALKILYE